MKITGIDWSGEGRMKTWCPKIREGQVSIRKNGKLFAIVCRTHREAEAVFRAIVRTMALVREGRTK